MLLKEYCISRIVKEVINEMIDEVSPKPYNPHMLDGIQSIDARSINIFIKAMIPAGNRVSINSPYKAIRQLVLYFSPKGAALHGGRLTKDIVNMMMSKAEFSSKIREIAKQDEKIKEYIYGDNKLTGKPLMQQIIWCLDEIVDQLDSINKVMENENFRHFFRDTEAMEGSKDGKRVGLSTILFNAYKGANEIRAQVKKMESILNIPDDPFSHNLGRTIRR